MLRKHGSATVRRSLVATACGLAFGVIPLAPSHASDMPTGQQLLDSLLSAEEVAPLTASGAVPGPASWPERCDSYNNRIMCQRGYVPTSDDLMPSVYVVSWLTDTGAALAQFRGEREFDRRHESSRSLAGSTDTRSLTFSQENGYPQVEALEVQGRLLVRVRCSSSPARYTAEQIAQCATQGLDAQWRKLKAKVPTVVPPSVPSFVTVQRSRDRANISWMRSQNDGGDANITYVVTSIPEGATCQTTGSSCDVTGLSNQREYSFNVRAQNSAGQSATAASPVVQGAPVRSQPVRSVKVTARDEGVRVVWKRPVRQAGAPVEYYRVTSRPESQECDTTKLRCDFDGLTPGKEYRFKVVAVNTAGESRPVTSSTVQVPRPRPLRPAPTISVPSAPSTPLPAATDKPAPSLS